MEPERKIEKQLRAYAQKRRDDAGDPLKLHPATRRLLQDEVSRRRPRPEPEEPSVSLWQLFRQQWAFLLGFALMVFLGATLFFPAISASKKRAQSLGTMANLKQIGVAAQMVAGENNGKLPASLDELTNGLVSKQTLTDPVSGKPFVYVAGGKNLDDLRSNDVLAYSSVDKDSRAVLFANGNVEFSSRFAELTNQRSTQLVLAQKVTHSEPASTIANTPMTAASPPPALAGAREMKEQPPGSHGISQLFVQAAAGNQQNYYRNMSESAQKEPVLQSFQLVQNGDVVSVVDRDGSVYNGSVQVKAARENEAERIPSNQAPPPEQNRAKADQLAGDYQLGAQNYFFRVAGSNGTVKQNVVFSGTLEAIPGETTNAAQTFGGGAGAGGVVSYNFQLSTNQQQRLLSNSRVVGTAVIGQTNRIEINAVPANR